MFVLYAIPLGLLAGWLMGGRLDALTSLHLRWAWLAVAGFLVQVAIFTDPLGPLIGDAAPTVYVGSNIAVLAAVFRNLAISGMTIVAIGAALNLAAILANGGAMPADPAALASLGILPPDGSNSVVVADPAFRPLTDLFAMPAWLPFANVFSVGDVLLAVGVAGVIAIAMRGTPANAHAGRDDSPAPSA